MSPVRSARSATRVIPKNLLLSAQQALDAPADGVTDSNLRDLCTLITISVLYDDVETLGSVAELHEDQKPYISPQYQSILERTGLRICVGPTYDDFQSVLNNSVPEAARVFTRDGTDARVQDLRELLSTALRVEISDMPDYWEDFAEGAEQLRGTPTTDQNEKARRFWLRSFLYAGLAKTRNCPFVPDAVRTWGFGDNKEGSPDYGLELEKVVDEHYPPERIRELVPDVRVDIPPFAAAVFVRAGAARSKIPEELKQLREQLAPVRETLAAFRAEREGGDYRGLLSIFGKPPNEAARVAVDGRVHDALQALRAATLPVSPGLLVLKPLYGVVTSATSLVSRLLGGDLTLASRQLFAIGKDAYALISGTSELAASNNTSAFLEVHNRIGWTLRGFLNEGADTRRLFGTIREDLPVRARQS